MSSVWKAIRAVCMTMSKHFSLHPYHPLLRLCAMKAIMVALKPAPFGQQPILPGYKNGMTGRAWSPWPRKEKSVIRWVKKLACHQQSWCRWSAAIRTRSTGALGDWKWVLDIAFDEDNNRTRKGHSAANFAVIRHIALTKSKPKKPPKWVSKSNAGWDDRYLLRILGLN